MYGVFTHNAGGMIWLTTADNLEHAKECADEYAEHDDVEEIFVIPLVYFKQVV